MKIVKVGHTEIAFTSDDAAGKFMAAITRGETLPDSTGTLPTIEMRTADPKEVEFLRLPMSEQAVFETWRDYAKNVPRDEITIAWNTGDRYNTGRFGYDIRPYRQEYVRRLIAAKDLASIERMLASFPTPAARALLPQISQVALDSALAGKWEEALALAGPEIGAPPPKPKPAEVPF